MSNPSEIKPKALLKCQKCRRLIERHSFEDHVSTCCFGVTSSENTLSCAGCMTRVEKSNLILHLLYESIHCRQAYSKTAFIQIFELRMQRAKVSGTEIKSAFNIMEKTSFKPSEEGSTFCNACGETLGPNSINDHFLDRSRCRREHIKLSSKVCSSCSQVYNCLLIHLTNNSSCQNPFFIQLKTAEDQAKLDSSDSDDQVEESYGQSEDKEILSNCELIEYCSVCGAEFKRNTILKHITKNENCESNYPIEDMKRLRKDCEAAKILKLRLWNKRRTGIDPNQKSNKELTLLRQFDKDQKENVKVPNMKKKTQTQGYND